MSFAENGPSRPANFSMFPDSVNESRSCTAGRFSTRSRDFAMALALPRNRRKYQSPPADAGREKRVNSGRPSARLLIGHNTCTRNCIWAGRFDERARRLPYHQLQPNGKLRNILIQHSLVSVAQLVEHRSVAPRVAGSNPVAHPNSFSQLACFPPCAVARRPLEPA